MILNRISAIFLSVFLIVGCTNNSGQKEAEEKSNEKIAAGEEKISKDCCMQSEEDFKQFLPDEIKGFTGANNYTIRLYCLKTAGSPSLGMRGYSDTNNVRYQVIIRDYCTSKYTEIGKLINPNTEKFDEANEIHFEGIEGDHYDGFIRKRKTPNDKNYNQLLYLKALVDKRFYVEVVGADKGKVEDLRTIFEELPTAKLATYRKPSV